MASTEVASLRKTDTVCYPSRVDHRASTGAVIHVQMIWKQTDWGINRAKGGGGKWERLSRGYVKCSKYPGHAMDTLHDSDLGTIKNSQAKMFSLKYWLRYKRSLLDVCVWMVKVQWLSGQTEQPKSVVMFAVFYDSRKDMCTMCVSLS